MKQRLSRRVFLAASALSAASGPSNAGDADKGSDPRNTALGQVKLEATLDGTPAFWTYSGVVYAVQPEQRPLPILALAGAQSAWATQRADGSFKIGGAILTFFRDPQTGAFLDTFDNPMTGRRNLVKPNQLSGGGVVYPADGSSARAEGQIKSAVVAPQGFKASDPSKALGAVRWSTAGPSIMLMTDRSWNVARQPQLEAQTQIADRAAFFDRKIVRLPTSFTSTTIIPWMTFMDMGSAPGHLVWHSSGQKVFSVDDLAAEYKARAGAKLDLLTSPPT